MDHRRQVMNTYKSLSDGHSFRLRLFAEGILVGIASGLVICFFRWGLAVAEEYRHEIYDLLSQQDLTYTAGWFAVLLVIGLILYKLTLYEPVAAGSGIPQVKGALLGLIKMNWLRIIWVKISAGILGIGAGLSLGREGPSIQLGAVAAQGVSRLLGRTRLEERYLITSGSSAGLAAAFNAPLAGVIFALEELHRNFSIMVLLPSMAAAMTATIISRLLFGADTIFEMPYLRPIPLEQFGVIITVAVVAGLAGVLFNKGLLNIGRLYNLPIFKTLLHKIIFALLIAGVLGFYLPDVLGGGNELINHIAKAPLPLSLLLLVLGGKFLFTLISYGCGVPGGIFLPMLVIGALSGSICANIFITFNLIDPVYAANLVVIAMAALFSSSVRAPITGTVLIMEMTASYEQLLSLAIASMVAFVIAEICHSKPIYEELLNRMLKNSPPKETTLQQRNIQEFCIANGSPIDGKAIKDIKWPERTLLVDIKRGEEQLTPNGEQKLMAGDFIYVLTENEYVEILQKMTEH